MKVQPESLAGEQLLEYLEYRRRICVSPDCPNCNTDLYEKLTNHLCDQTCSVGIWDITCHNCGTLLKIRVEHIYDVSDKTK